MENVAECGSTWRELSVKYDPVSCSWKTHRCLFQEDLQPSSLTLPRWGSMRNGVLLERTTPDFCTSEKGFGYLPTPKASMDGVSPKTLAMVLRGQAEKSLPRLLKMIGLTLQPNFAEWLMGWPIDWTNYTPLETDKFQEWLRQHSPSWPNN